MVRIRLRRTGKKKQASFRVVVADSESPRDGKFIEIIGHYNPRTDPPTVVIKEDRALYWLSEGAQPSDAVARMLRNMGTMAKFEAVKRGEPLPETEAEAEVDATAVAEVEVEVEAEAEDEVAATEEAEEGAEIEVEAETPAQVD